MKNLFISIFLFLCSSVLLAKSNFSCGTSHWTSKNSKGELVNGPSLSQIQFANYNIKIRNGFLQENLSVPFRGNVIYYQGLGDSMLNHKPLFELLTENGFRVIAFDYMGQGGSEGSMNNTRIADISLMGDIFWKRYAKDLNLNSKKTIVGWSTGGLAAYLESIERSENLAKIVLIAPGIVPNLIVGEQQVPQLKFNKITLASLTKATYNSTNCNPHLDPIKPESPLEVPLFALDLVEKSMYVNGGNLSLVETFPTAELPFISSPIVQDSIKGFVLLSGADDTYVNALVTEKILKTTAVNFEIKDYPLALHEIDNESSSEVYQNTGPQARADILAFLIRN